MGPALAPIMLGTALIGTAVSAAGTYSSLQAQSANSAYQAQVAANNAKTAEENANMTLQQGGVKTDVQGLKTRAQVGATKGGEAASGVDVNSGSFAKVRSSESELGMVDALTIRSNAAKEAWAQENQATGFQAESGLLSSESTQQSEAAPVAAVGSALTNASTATLGYYRYMQG